MNENRKNIIISLAIVLLLAAAGFFAFRYMDISAELKKVQSDKSDIEMELAAEKLNNNQAPKADDQLPQSSNSQAPEDNNRYEGFADSATVVDNYLQSPYRALMVIKHPAQPYSVVLATNRSIEGMGNDAACGSIYTAPTCYFFLEPEFDATAPKRKFIAKLEGSGAIDMKSLKFTGPAKLEFKTFEGDGGYSQNSTYVLDITTGTITRTSFKESNG